MRSAQCAVRSAQCGVRSARGAVPVVVALLGAVVAAQTPRPQDDLYQFVNHTWLQQTPIPDDRVTHSASSELVDRVEQQLRVIIDGVAAGTPARGSEAQLIADLYRSVVDAGAIERAGLSPVAADLARFDAIDGVKAASVAAGLLSVAGEGGPFEVTLVTAGRRNSRIVARVDAGGLLLPDWSYYLAPSAQVLSVRRDYARYLARVLAAAGRPQPVAEAEAGAVLAFETRMADALRAHTGGPISPRVWSFSEIERAMPGFGWKDWAKPQGLDQAGGIILDYPEFFRAFAALVGGSPPGTLAAWLRVRFLTAMAPYLPDALASARFDFFGTTLTGQRAPRERWKRAVSMVSEFLGDAIGRRYVAAHFSDTARRRVRAMVAHMVEAAREGVDDAPWLTPEIRAASERRLATVQAQVGYPDEWRSYAGLRLQPDTLVENLRRLRAFETRYRMSRARVPADSRQWLTSPQTVNAYYSPRQHEIALPAGILQPPYFDPAADDAENFGAIGAVIGHEISHALDVRGLAPQARALQAQLAAIEVAPGVRLNADLTLAETLADVVGLQLAYRAYLRSLDGRPAPVIEGRTAAERFVTAWARIWRGQSRPDYLRYTNETSPHPPPQFRANVAVSHLDAFHEAFGVGPGDRLYRAAPDRVRVW